MSSTTGAHSLLLYFSKFARIIVPEVPKKYPSQSFSQTLSPDKITNTMKSTLLLLAAGLFLLASCKPPEPPKLTATDTGKSGPGGQTIKGGDVTMSFSADGKPLTFTRGNGTNLINTKNPGHGFYMTTGSGPDEKIIPFTSLESQDGKLILTAADSTRATLAVNAGNSHISFRLEKIENVPKGSEPILRL